MGLGADDPLVLVTAGGGGDGMALLEAYVQALRLEPAGWTSLMAPGPFMPDAQRRWLETLCRVLPAVIIRPFEHDVPSLLHPADAPMPIHGFNPPSRPTGPPPRPAATPPP